jgi:hypothetical protein
MKERGLQKASRSCLVHQGDIMMIEGSLEVEADVRNEDGDNQGRNHVHAGGDECPPKSFKI